MRTAATGGIYASDRAGRMLAAPPRTFSGGVVARRSHTRGALGAGDLKLLVWVSEQYAVRVDQIAVLRGCGARAAQYTLARLRIAGLVEMWRPLTGADELGAFDGGGAAFGWYGLSPLGAEVGFACACGGGVRCSPAGAASVSWFGVGV